MRLHSLWDIAERELEVVHELRLTRDTERSSLFIVMLHCESDQGADRVIEGAGFTPSAAAEQVYEKMVRWLDGD